MKNPNGPSIEQVDDWHDAQRDEAIAEGDYRYYTPTNSMSEQQKDQSELEYLRARDNALDAYVHELTGDEGDDDSLTVLKNFVGGLQRAAQMCICDDVHVHRLVTFFERVDAWAADHPILVTKELGEALRAAKTASGSLSLHQNTQISGGTSAAPNSSKP